MKYYEIFLLINVCFNLTLRNKKHIDKRLYMKITAQLQFNAKQKLAVITCHAHMLTAIGSDF